MPNDARVIVSAFGDEAAINKTATEQFAALSAIGLEYYSLRFIDVGEGVKNVMDLSKGEITRLRHLEDQYGMNVTSIGSPNVTVARRQPQGVASTPHRSSSNFSIVSAMRSGEGFDAT